MKNLKLDYLEKEYKHIKYYNSLAPFPIYDTDYVNSVKNELDKEVKRMNEEFDYDKLPVYACKHCKHLNIEIDDDYNEICMRCGSINEVDEYENIYEYKKKWGELWK